MARYDMDETHDHSRGRPGGDRVWQGPGGSSERSGRGEYGSGYGGASGYARMQHDMSEGGHRGKGPKNYIRSDERITEDLNERLSVDDSLDAREIEVTVLNAEVTLSGTVASRRDKRRAEDCADAVSGITHVQNNLRVRPSSGSSGGDQGAMENRSGSGSDGAKPG